MRYFWFADRFGWSPRQVDEQPVALLRRLMMIGSVRDELTEDRRSSEG